MIKLKATSVLILIIISYSKFSCKEKPSCHDEMLVILDRFNDTPNRQGYRLAKIPYADSLLIVTQSIQGESKFCKCLKADMLMKFGQKEEAIKVLEDVEKEDKAEKIKKVNL